MAELFDLLPNIILYLASGFAFICGYYFLIDKRFDFFFRNKLLDNAYFGFFVDKFNKSITKFVSCNW